MIGHRMLIIAGLQQMHLHAEFSYHPSHRHIHVRRPYPDVWVPTVRLAKRRQ